MDHVIVGDLMLDPTRFFIDVVDGVVVLQGRVERSRLIPFLSRAVHGVEGLVRVEDRLTSDIDNRDADLALTYPRVRGRAMKASQWWVGDRQAGMTPSPLRISGMPPGWQ